MNVIDIDYACLSCGEYNPERPNGMICKCGGKIRGDAPGICGTRDSFGIKKAFRDSDGKEIDNWKSWEKAGYRNPLDVVKNDAVKQQIKEKIKKVHKERGK